MTLSPHLPPHGHGPRRVRARTACETAMDRRPRAANAPLPARVRTVIDWDNVESRSSREPVTAPIRIGAPARLRRSPGRGTGPAVGKRGRRALMAVATLATALWAVASAAADPVERVVSLLSQEKYFRSAGGARTSAAGRAQRAPPSAAARNPAGAGRQARRGDRHLRTPPERSPGHVRAIQQSCGALCRAGPARRRARRAVGRAGTQAGCRRLRQSRRCLHEACGSRLFARPRCRPRATARTLQRTPLRQPARSDFGQSRSKVRHRPIRPPPRSRRRRHGRSPPRPGRRMTVRWPWSRNPGDTGAARGFQVASRLRLGGCMRAGGKIQGPEGPRHGGGMVARGGRGCDRPAPEGQPGGKELQRLPAGAAECAGSRRKAARACMAGVSAMSRSYAKAPARTGFPSACSGARAIRNDASPNCGSWAIRPSAR